MTLTTLDLLYVALVAVVMPLWDYLVWWPSFERQRAVDPIGARKRLWIDAIAYPWVLVFLGAILWTVNDRSWIALGLGLPTGWRLGIALGLVLLLLLYYLQASLAVARDAAARATVRAQLSGELANVLPRTRSELTWFGGVSMTAGFCEEWLYRGYLIWAGAPWIGWWGAAGVSLLIFAAGHAYQGWSGMIRTGVVGALFTSTVAIFESLWPAIALHAVVDAGSGVMAWLALRDDP